ncbi:putative C69 family dipeptidase [Blattamonas nauphoetae]|uniref:C69 family dipeptidase n=1 Tax=Blattamonas nauphoetae TaxID=2049346 RepID=A0ABQ9Y0P0_9EUKA|nr:putative C69 family dipeptidase [Blattamonas nauphoetae]
MIRLLTALLCFNHVWSCTNLIATKGATRINHNIITYSADSQMLYGEVYSRPKGKHPEGTMRKIIEWDTYEELGEIPEVAETYTVVGNMNEHGLAIGETTWGGIDELGGANGIIDYGSLIYITLERSKTAQEAIKTMDFLVQTYGYHSSGETFTISDTEEIWVMDLIGKGANEKGAIWVAIKLPDGSVCGHANQARIQSLDHYADTTVKTSEGLLAWLKEHKYFDGVTLDTFDFSQTFNPITFGGARHCDARAWSFFCRVRPEMESYADYARGHDLTNRMPLYFKVTEEEKNKIDVPFMMDAMRDHYEGTALDYSSDVGAGPFNLPYRWRPMEWEYDGKKYVHERSIAAQQTGWTMVAESRWEDDYAKTGRGILWFGMGDAATSLFVPFYPVVTEIHESCTTKTGSIQEFSFESFYWVSCMITNYAYTNYNSLYPTIKEKLDSRHKSFEQDVLATDNKMKDVADPVAELTKIQLEWSAEAVRSWLEYYCELFPQYFDGVVRKPTADRDPEVQQTGYSEEWKKRIVEDTGDHYKVLERRSVKMEGSEIKTEL